MTEIAQITNTISSNRVRRMLGHDLDWWNSAMLLSLGAVAIAAVAVVLTTYAVLKLQKQAEVETRIEFDRYKLASDLRALELTNEAVRLHELSRSNALVNLTNRSVMDAIIVAQGLGTREKMSEATRVLYIISKLEPFAGKQFDAVVTSSSLELVALMGALKAALITAGWVEVERSDIDTSQTPSVGGPALVKIEVDASKDPKLSDAAMALASALEAEHISTKVYPKADATNANVIHLLIGPKP
jgi:hypothetical protein